MNVSSNTSRSIKFDNGLFLDPRLQLLDDGVLLLNDGVLLLDDRVLLLDDGVLLVSVWTR